MGLNNERDKLLLARFLVEPREESKVSYDNQMKGKRQNVLTTLLELVDEYKIYSEKEEVANIKTIREELGSCKNTLKDAIEVEDMNENGLITYKTLKNTLIDMDLDLEPEVMDFLLLKVYERSKSSYKMEYGRIFELLEGASDDGDDYSDDEFKKEEKSMEKSEEKSEIVDPRKETSMAEMDEAEGEGEMAGMEDSEMMIDTAENCLVKIANELIQKKITIK